MRRSSRTPTRTGRRAPRGRRRSTSRAAGRAVRSHAATAAARVRRTDDGGPSGSNGPPHMPESSTLDVSPGLLPLRVVHAVALAVAAVLLGRLPELDRAEIRGRGVGVVLRAGALGQL